MILLLEYPYIRKIIKITSKIIFKVLGILIFSFKIGNFEYSNLVISNRELITDKNIGIVSNVLACIQFIKKLFPTESSINNKLNIIEEINILLPGVGSPKLLVCFDCSSYALNLANLIAPKTKGAEVNK